MTPATPTTTRRNALAAAVIDVVAVVAFVLIGRRSHDETAAVAGVLGTVWPFLVGLAVGWALARAWRNPIQLLPTGVIIWVLTVLLGLGLRGVTGGGLAWTFLAVTAVVLAVFLLGWRAVAQWLTRRAALPRT